MTSSKKPKCGAGQSCGFACIEASRTCTEKLDGAVSKAAVEALRSHATAALATVATESTDFRGRSFTKVQAKFSANDAKHTIASTIVDHGEGITTQKVTLVASDDSGDTLTHTLLRMAADGDQPERIFTLADGAAKEYTDAAKHGYWNESRDAAVRAAISRLPDKKPTVAEPASPAPDSYPKPLPYDYSDYDIDLYSKKKAIAPDKLKESFVHMFPDLADKADDYLTAESLRLKQDKAAQRSEVENSEVENKAADKVAAVEDKLYNRQPTGKTAAEYNTELLAKAKTFALEQGFDNSKLTEREQNVLAAHDFSHPVAHMIFGGNSTDIHQQMGSIMTSDGRPSFSAEESLASAVESLSRGYSLPRAVATAVSQAQRLSITYQDKEPARDYFWSQEFSDHVAGFVSAMVRHPDFKQISQAVRPHNVESGIRA